MDFFENSFNLHAVVLRMPFLIEIPREQEILFVTFQCVQEHQLQPPQPQFVRQGEGGWGLDMKKYPPGSRFQIPACGCVVGIWIGAGG